MILKDYLKLHKMRQSDFAEKIGISTQSIRNYISGHRVPNSRVLRLIEEITEGEVTMKEMIDHSILLRSKK